ncbi:hypothetical protein K3495_g8708 [Podosphaera aphanis]|nr:hypothetical protein K3495_g8708 [Podosphaera aphanis]
MRLLQIVVTSGLFACVAAINAQLVGTWASKSGATLTGPSFYNPVDDVFIEPSHTGISYSFTSDGFYEEAYYRAIANPRTPSCPQAILQFQHGTFVENADGSLTLSPFAVDGRQLQSDPCSSRYALYTRYNQSETMQKYQVYTDAYTKMPRLDLYQFDGSRLLPLYLAYSPPQMLPTVTMNPTSTATIKKVKRTAGPENNLDYLDFPLNKHASHLKREEAKPSLVYILDPNMIWWGGVGMVLFGGAAYLL